MQNYNMKNLWNELFLKKVFGLSMEKGVGKKSLLAHENVL